MSFVQDLVDGGSKALVPHTERIGHHIDNAQKAQTARLAEVIRELRQQSDLGRPDTGDAFKFFIVRRQVTLGTAGEQIPINLVTNVPNDDSGPTLGEIWAIQAICVNGLPNKSPGFSVRTNTGRLLFAVVAEGMGNESVSGTIILLQGETIVFEPLATGVFDFTLTVLLRKYRRQSPDAGAGVSQEHYEGASRTQEHEPERDFPGHSYVPTDEEFVGVTQDYGGHIGPDSVGDGSPEQF